MFILPFTYRNPNLDTCYLTLLQIYSGQNEPAIADEIVGQSLTM